MPGVRNDSVAQTPQRPSLAEAAVGGLDGWDPVLLALSPSMPEELSLKRPGKRALQWTARLGSGVYLRSNCPAVWTVIPEDSPRSVPTGVEGGAEALQHVRYEASCGLNGRMDLESGQPIPFRGDGELSGEIWWDPEARWVVEHSLSLSRTVHSRWPGQSSALELIQEQEYTVRVRRSPAASPPEPLRPLAIEDVRSVVEQAKTAWSACARLPGPHAVTLEARQGGALAVRAAGVPVDAPQVVPDVGGLPRRGEQLGERSQLQAVADLTCWQSAVDELRLPPHDHLGERFDFVLPRADAAFGAPGIIDRGLPRGRPHFVVSELGQLETVAAWLGVI